MYKMRAKTMITLRILIFVLWMGCCASDVTTKQKIERNRAWLEQRALIKMYKNSTHKNDYYRKIIKFYDNESKNRAENEIIFPPKNRRPHQYENDSYELIEDSINNTTWATSTTARMPQTTRTTVIRQQISSTVDEMDTTTPAMTNGTRKNVTKKPVVAKKKNSKNSGKKLNKKITPTTTTATSTTTTTTTSTTIKPLTTVVPMNSDENETSKMLDRKKIVDYKWGPWSKWGTCSRSCGGGVKIQTRHCLSKSSDKVLTPNNDTSLDCIGIFRRYHICNEQNCSNVNTDFRAEQCTHFNTHVFQGKQYEWEPYIKDDAECELNCKPLGINYFATLNETVIDGTPCTKPVDIVKHTLAGRAICVEGACKVSNFLCNIIQTEIF